MASTVVLLRPPARLRMAVTESAETTTAGADDSVRPDIRCNGRS